MNKNKKLQTKQKFIFIFINTFKQEVVEEEKIVTKRRVQQIEA